MNYIEEVNGRILAHEHPDETGLVPVVSIDWRGGDIAAISGELVAQGDDRYLSLEAPAEIGKPITIGQYKAQITGFDPFSNTWIVKRADT